MLDLLIVLAFVAVSVGAGLAARRQASRGLREYFLAGGTLRGWQAGTSMAATQFAADTPLVVMGLIATAGLYALWQLWVYAIAFLALAFVFGAKWQRSGVLTDAELTEIRYSGRGVLALRAVKAVYYGTVINCIVLAMVLKATVSITEVFLPWNEWLPAGLYGPLSALVASTGVTVASGLTGLAPEIASTNNLLSVLVILAFVALYSMTGGLRGVVVTDIVQFALAIVGTCLFAWFALDAAGGLGGFVDRLSERYGDAAARRMIAFVPPAEAALMPFLVIMSLQWLFQASSDGTGYLAQRTMACRDERAARGAGVTFAWLQVLLRSVPWVLIGLALLLVFPFAPGEVGGPDFKASREFAFIRGIDELLPSGARGLMLVAMLAALASTLDTHMNWGASYWSNDLYGRLVNRAWLKREPGRREQVLVARLSSAAMLVIALSIVPALGSIQQAWKLSLLFGAGVGSVLVLRWLWERINLWSEVSAMVVSIGAAPLLLWATEWRDDLEWVRLASMAGVSTLAVVIAALIGPPTDPAVLARFHERVRPLGWWKRAAATSAAPMSDGTSLGREAVGILITALSLYGALWGLVRLLVPHPEVGALWPVLALLISAGLVPVWIRRIRPAHASPATDG